MLGRARDNPAETNWQPSLRRIRLVGQQVLGIRLPAEMQPVVTLVPLAVTALLPLLPAEVLGSRVVCLAIIDRNN